MGPRKGGSVRREQEEPQSGTWVEGDDPEVCLRIRKVRLAVLDGPDAGASAAFAKTPIVLGRRAADLTLTDKKVSSLHAEIRLERDGFRLRDLGSSNGTFVMGLRVADVFLYPGAVIGLGDSAVRFEPLGTSVAVPLSSATKLGDLIGASLSMRRLYQQIGKVASASMPVLITGETGTGKELVAEAIHQFSDRADGPFVVLDCGTVPPDLFASVLFGHEAGAFTGATTRHKGVLERADGGTLFLDELGEVPTKLQPQLLRALDAKSFRRVGGTAAIDSDFRTVAATNRDLRAEVNRKTFRADLYFRVAVATLETPPLRERREDIEMLIAHFSRDGLASELPEGFLGWALAHPWPGNVRELRNAVLRARVLGVVPELEPKTDVGAPIDLKVPFREAKRRLVEAFERRYLRELLEAHGWNIAAAARAARVDRMSIYKMLQRLGIERAEP